MILQGGMKVLVSHRRLFETDHARLFVGVVQAYEDGMASVTGHTWARDWYDGTYQKKDDERTKILALASGTMILYRLPEEVDLSNFRVHTEGAKVFARDDSGFEMDLTEGGLHGGEAASLRTA